MSPDRHALLTLVLMMALLISFVWNEYNVPKSLALEPVLAIGPLLMISFVYVWVKLMCNNATWHVGKLKRVILRGALSFILACGCSTRIRGYVRMLPVHATSVAAVVASPPGFGATYAWRNRWSRARAKKKRLTQLTALPCLAT